MKLELIDTPEALAALAPEWSAFVRAHPDSTPFQLPEWLLTWWKHFGSGRLHTLVLRDGSQLCGVFPCFLHTWQAHNQLTLIGTGITDYLDPVLAVGAEREFIDLLQVHLNNWPEWKVCDWPNLVLGSHLLALKAAEVKTGMPCGAIPFDTRFDEFWSERGKDLRRNVRRYREKAERERPLRFEVVAGARSDLVDAVMRLHTQRWQTQGEPGMVEANHSEQFMRDVAVQMDSLGIVRFFSLWFGQELGAAVLVFVYQEQVFAYMSAFDPRFESLGLGRTMLHEALRYSFPRYRAWNFLRGDEAYKSSWGAKFIPRARLKLQRPRSS